MFASTTLLPAALLLGGAVVVSAAEIKCPIVLDGRVPAAIAATKTALDTKNGIFNPDFVKGNGLKWSDILGFPALSSARFDDNGAYAPVEVGISDASVFQKQTGFRRAGLQFAADANDGVPGWQGVRTLHWSVRQDAARPLNLSHEYLAVWHEAADFSANQLNFQVGRMIDFPDLPPDEYKIFDRDFKLLYSVPVDTNIWQNFAVNLDIPNNKVKIYYSLGDAVLAPVTDSLSVDLSGEGQYQFGILKKPTGVKGKDIPTSGYQEPGIDEAQLYGSVFVEDGANGCISL